MVERKWRISGSSAGTSTPARPSTSCRKQQDSQQLTQTHDAAQLGGLFNQRNPDIRPMGLIHYYGKLHRCGDIQIRPARVLSPAR